MLIGDYIKTCRTSYNLLELLVDRQYLLESVHNYSLRDLMVYKDLLSFVYTIMEKYILHVKSCETCKGKGYYCQICKSDQVLFPFELKLISKCPGNI